MDAVLKKSFLSCLLLSFIVSGCATAAISGAQAVYTRQSIKESMNDHYATLAAYRKIYLDTDKFKNTNVSVVTFNNTVLLAGQVENDTQKNEIEELVRKSSGLEKIHNLITIAAPTTSLVRMSDTWITAKIKAKLVANNDLDPSKIKVFTENGTVYLMGIVPPDQANIAIDIARTTAGVEDVVKVFEYIRITQA